MITINNDLPPHVLGVTAKGEVTADDLKNVLLPALQKQADDFGEINYLLILDTRVENWTAGSWFQDMLAGFKHLTKWNRVAVVTEQSAVEKITDAVSVIAPGEYKGFTHAELATAKEWVSTA